jgi:hypothetical protein
MEHLSSYTRALATTMILARQLSVHVGDVIGLYCERQARSTSPVVDGLSVGDILL